MKAVVDQVVERADAPRLVAQGHVMAETEDVSEQLVKCLVVTELCQWVTQ